MAEILLSNGYLQQTHNFEPLFSAVDPMSVLLPQNSLFADRPILPVSLDLCFAMERGPRYRAYAERRERKLRLKQMRQLEEPDTTQTPPRKQVKFQESSITSRKTPSLLAQSVPDFSSMMRKENQKPNTNMLSPLLEMTPPTTKKSTKGNIGSSCGSSARGSKSVSAVQEKRGGMMVRKSYACVQELKGFSSMAATSMGGERTSTRNSTRTSTTRRSVMGSRQYYL